MKIKTQIEKIKDIGAKLKQINFLNGSDIGQQIKVRQEQSTGVLGVLTLAQELEEKAPVFVVVDVKGDERGSRVDIDISLGNNIDRISINYSNCPVNFIDCESLGEMVARVKNQIIDLKTENAQWNLIEY